MLAPLAPLIADEEHSRSSMCRSQPTLGMEATSKSAAVGASSTAPARLQGAPHTPAGCSRRLHDSGQPPSHKKCGTSCDWHSKKDCRPRVFLRWCLQLPSPKHSELISAQEEGPARDRPDPAAAHQQQAAHPKCSVRCLTCLPQVDATRSGQLSGWTLPRCSVSSGAPSRHSREKPSAARDPARPTAATRAPSGHVVQRAPPLLVGEQSSSLLEVSAKRKRRRRQKEAPQMAIAQTRVPHRGCNEPTRRGAPIRTSKPRSRRRCRWTPGSAVLKCLSNGHLSTPPLFFLGRSHVLNLRGSLLTDDEKGCAMPAAPVQQSRVV